MVRVGVWRKDRPIAAKLAKWNGDLTLRLAQQPFEMKE
jgi:hypothetical protein